MSQGGLEQGSVMSGRTVLALAPGPVAPGAARALAQRPPARPHPALRERRLHPGARSNMATARRIGLAVSQSILVRADRVI
jgi:hypothetical protein